MGAQPVSPLLPTFEWRASSAATPRPCYPHVIGAARERPAQQASAGR